jgi:hypothetical protein
MLNFYCLLHVCGELQVRFASLKLIEEMARKLGDLYEKLLLPETVVTLTELIEGKSTDLMVDMHRRLT